jgi:hypothetical protein
LIKKKKGKERKGKGKEKGNDYFTIDLKGYLEKAQKILISFLRAFLFH